jgi:hypothetical protein
MSLSTWFGVVLASGAFPVAGWGEGAACSLRQDELSGASQAQSVDLFAVQDRALHSVTKELAALERSGGGAGDGGLAVRPRHIPPA